MKTEFARMKSLSLHAGQFRPQVPVRNGCKPARVSVGSVPDHGMSDGVQMDPDLMGSPRLDFHLEECHRPEAFGDPPPRQSFPSPRAFRGHPFPVSGVPSHGKIDDALVPSHVAVDEGAVYFPDLPLPELIRQSFVGGVVFGDHHDPRRPLVEPVNNPGAKDTSDPGQIPQTVQKGVDEGTPDVAGRGMDDHAGRLHHNSNVLILIEDPEREVFGDKPFFDGRGMDETDGLAGRKLTAGLRFPAPDLHQTPIDQLLDPGTGERRDTGGEKNIQPRPGLRRGHKKFKCLPFPGVQQALLSAAAISRPGEPFQSAPDDVQFLGFDGP